MKTNSSVAEIDLRSKYLYYFDLFLLHLRNSQNTRDFDNIKEEVLNYQQIAARYVSRDLSECETLEIGFGQRPFQLFWMHGMGFPVHGIDLDAPIIKMSLSDVIEVTRKNGLERAAKTLLRNMLFDRKTWRDFRLAIELETSTQFTAPIDRLIVGNAASVDSWQKVPRRLDFIYSDDVFEHVPAEDLEAVVENMADRLRPDGLAVISPMIFTGICGGHLVEWYRGSLRTDAVHRSEPWEHLRKRRFTADTYLNEFARDDYRAIFSRRFEIVEEISADPSLGREFLTDDIRKELSDYSEEDLFSNKVRFILRQKT